MICKDLVTGDHSEGVFGLGFKRILLTSVGRESRPIGTPAFHSHANILVFVGSSIQKATVIYHLKTTFKLTFSSLRITQT